MAKYSEKLGYNEWHITRMNWISALLLCLPADLLENIWLAWRILYKMPKWLAVMMKLGRNTQKMLAAKM